jgi:hypothetical protein
VWLSLVEHLVRDEGVAGSNPATPTKLNRNKPICCDTSANEPRVRPGQLPGQKSQRKRLDDGRPRKNNFPTPIRATLLGSNRCEALGFTGRGHSPVFALCRALVAAGHDPRRSLHAYRGEVLALKVPSIGEGARLTVREDRAGPRFVSWEPFPRWVGACAREKAEGIGSAPDQSDEPSAPPGAAVRASKSLPAAQTDSWGKGPAAGVALRGRSLVQPTQNNCAKGARDERQG